MRLYNARRPCRPYPYDLVKLVYISRTGFKNGGLRERPLTEKGGLSERPLTGKTLDFGAKNNKEMVIFFSFFILNEGLFDLPGSEKRNNELYMFEKGVFWSGRPRSKK